MNKFSKKIVILAVCLLFSAGLALNCLAVNGLSTSQSQKVSANSSFTLNINLEYSSSTPIVFVMLSISYPTEYLAVVGHTNGTLFSECTTYLSTTGSYGLSFDATDSNVLDGRLATISFTTSKDFTGSSYVPLSISAKVVVDGETKELSAFHMVNYSTIGEDDIVIDEDEDIVVDEDEDIVVDDDEDVVIDDDEDIVIDEDGDVEITVTKATQATTTAKTTAKTTTATTTKITTPATTTTPETTTEPTTEATTEVTTEATTEAVQTTVTLPTPAPETDASEGEDDAPKKASGGGVIAAAIVIIILSVCAVLGIEYYKAVFIK